MESKFYRSIDMTATGKRIAELRVRRGYTVADLQRYFGFEAPQAIYKWQKGQSLPSTDNLYALSWLLEVPMEEILVPMNINNAGLREVSRGPDGFLGGFGRQAALSDKTQTFIRNSGRMFGFCVDIRRSIGYNSPAFSRRRGRHGRVPND